MNKPLANDELRQFVNTDHTIFYIEELFKNCRDADQSLMVEIRKIGKYQYNDGSTSLAEISSSAQILQFNQSDWISDLAGWATKHVLLAAPYGIGTFMCPALLNDRKANDKSVQCLVSVCADFDKGNPKKNLDNLISQLGTRPTIIALSGGTTDEGFPKLHAHWRLDKPCYEPWKIAYIREQIAKRYGADESFKRISQVIRLPGSLYDKTNKSTYTEIIEHNNKNMDV